MRRILASTFLATTLFPLACLAGDLTVTIDHVRNDRGSILAALYDSESSFLQQPSARARFKVKAVAGTVQYVIHDLPPGRYALSVFHDENDNGQLDRNVFGFPSEGYGFSRDARAHHGPPGFSSAAFDFDGGSTAITIALHY
jgi:uncharacterized protein (DUF2141 family)